MTPNKTTTPAFTDFTEPSEIEALKSYAEEFKPMERRPLQYCTLQVSTKVIPKGIVDIVMPKIKELNYGVEISSYLPYAVEVLVYEAQVHKDDDWSEWFTCRKQTPYGSKNLSYKIQHPDIDDLNNLCDGFEEFYLDMIYEGADEKQICRLIAFEIAEFNMGEDFMFFFYRNIDRLSGDVNKLFMAEAKGILEKLKQKVQQ